MATRSIIAKVENFGFVRSIYCHWDGYLSANGATLLYHYQNAEKVDRLLNLGDISALYERVRPLNGETQNFYNPIENVTIAYIDRGDECPAKKHHNQKALVDYFNGSWCDFLYLFKNGVWYYRQRGDKRFKKLTVKNTSEN